MAGGYGDAYWCEQAEEIGRISRFLEDEVVVAGKLWRKVVIAMKGLQGDHNPHPASCCLRLG